jgi:hypothetical protein
MSPDGAKPLFPLIFGTGFFVHKDGIVATNRHVVEALADFAPHPETGKTGVAALLFCPSIGPTGEPGQQMMMIDLKGSTSVNSFKSTDQWYGNALPDIGFVQLQIRNVPALDLAREDFYVRAGMPIAAAGYPMGDTPLTALDKLNQLMPFVRRGIVSSVFPFPVPQPHGFTIDIMQQGGSSGSPIFRVDEPKVIGMMAQSVIDWDSVQNGTLALAVAHNTNVSICEPSPRIQEALSLFLQLYPPDLSGIPTLEERLAEQVTGGTLEWEAWVRRPG